MKSKFNECIFKKDIENNLDKIINNYINSDIIYCEISSTKVITNKYDECVIYYQSNKLSKYCKEKNVSYNELGFTINNMTKDEIFEDIQVIKELCNKPVIFQSHFYSPEKNLAFKNRKIIDEALRLYDKQQNNDIILILADIFKNSKYEDIYSKYDIGDYSHFSKLGYNLISDTLVQQLYLK